MKKIHLSFMLIIFFILLSPFASIASDYLPDLLSYSKEIGVARIVNGEISNGKASQYSYAIVMQHDIFNAGRAKVESEKLVCDCQLKVGGSYVVFIVVAQKSAYIRAAYEVLPGDSSEARMVASGKPIVLVADTDIYSSRSLLLSSKFPENYQENVLTSEDNVMHKFSSNAWYRLSEVEAEIAKEAKFLQRNKKYPSKE
jgi:hypothetical protein